MSDQQLRRISPFEAIRHTDDSGADYWNARELMALLGYQKWQDFSDAIDRAKEDCERSARSVEDNFTRARKNPSATGGRPGVDYHLTKYACHLITMAARTNDAITAHARTYFSDQVEAAETVDAQLAAIEALIQQARERVEMRSRLTDSYNQLEAIASAMGMKRKGEFARLHNEGDLGMFGMSKDDLAVRHDVQPQHGKARVNMNDHFGTTLLSGVHLRNAFAGADITGMGHASNEEMYRANREAGEEMRAMFRKHGLVPEDIPPEPHISEAQRIANGQIPLEQMPPMALPDPKDEPPQEGC